MTAHDHALIRVFATLDGRYHVVIFDRAQLEVVADVKLQLEGAAFSDHLLDDVELMLVELNIGHLGQVVEVGLRIVHHLAVVERADGHCGRLDEAQGTSLNHLLIIQSRELLVRKHLVLLAVHVVAAAHLHVLLGDLGVLLLNLFTDRIASCGAVDRPTGVLAGDQHPSPFQGSLDALELLVRARLHHHMSLLHALCTGGIRRCREVQRHAVLAQHSSEPRTTVESHGHLARLFQVGLDTPTFELPKHPLRRILIGV